jgi:signal transduction histidine kinase
LNFGECKEAKFSDSVLEDLESIERSAKRILRVAKKARRVDQFDLDGNKETKDLSAMIRSDIAALENEHPNVTFDVALPEYVPVATRGTISIAIHELLENAILHNDTPGETRVEIEAETSVTSAVEIVISDNGPGIEESELKPIIDGEETPLDHGSSLGLWLARWVLKNHDGELELTGSDDGTTAKVVLPVEPMPKLKSSLPTRA